MQAMPRQRNVTIDLWKFVYGWFIVIYHIYNATGLHFKGGYYVVEFYLLAAGVFFFRTLEKHAPDPPPGYVGRRFMRFFPWSFSAFLFAFIVIRLVIDGRTSFGAVSKDLSGDIWEVLLVDMTGLNGGDYPVNVPAWTLSSMFLVEVLMLGFYRYKKAFVHIVLPLTLMAGFGYWRTIPKAHVPLWVGFTSFGTLRAWLVYGCAYYCLQLSKFLRDTRFTHAGELALTGLETACHAFAIAAMLNTEAKTFQWCALLAFFLAVAVETSGHSLWNRALQRFSRPIGWLGSFSLSVYLMHRPVTRYFEMLYPDTAVYYAHLPAVLAAIIACSLAQYFLVTGLLRLWRKNKGRIKALFVQPPDAGR